MNEKKITKNVECLNPKCRETVKWQGNSGKKVRIICPKCKTRMYFQFPKTKKDKIKP